MTDQPTPDDDTVPDDTPMPLAAVGDEVPIDHGEPLPDDVPDGDVGAHEDAAPGAAPQEN